MTGSEFIVSLAATVAILGIALALTCQCIDLPPFPVVVTR